MPDVKIEYFARGVIAEAPENHEKFLLVIIKIVCPHCGEIDMQLPGHHLRAIRDTLVEMIDRFPELCHLADTLDVQHLPALPPTTTKES